MYCKLFWIKASFEGTNAAYRQMLLTMLFMTSLGIILTAVSVKLLHALLESVSGTYKQWAKLPFTV